MTDIIAMHRADLVDAVTAAVKPLKAERDALAAELAELKPRERLLYDEFSKSRDRTRELEAALRELVRLKDLKTDAEAINTSGSWEAKHKQDAMRADYEKAKPLAWDAARRALTPLETKDE